MNGKWRFVVLIVIVIVIVGLLLAACGGDDDKDSKNGNDEGASSSAPDLIISGIELDPAQPAAGEDFTLAVTLKNDGDAPAGACDIVITLRDVTRGTTTPIANLHRDELDPGEEVEVYRTADRRVSESGSYQIQAELRPDFKDGNEQNNTKMRAFTVD